jgi:hypothetical protein
MNEDMTRSIEQKHTYFKGLRVLNKWDRGGNGAREQKDCEGCDESVGIIVRISTLNIVPHYAVCVTNVTMGNVHLKPKN